MCGMKDWVEDDIRYVSSAFIGQKSLKGDLISSEEGRSGGGPENYQI